jgi:hypothetical protein
VRAALILLATGAAIAASACLPSNGDRIHVVRNGTRACVYTTNHGRLFPADAGACEGVEPKERP